METTYSTANPIYTTSTAKNKTSTEFHTNNQLPQNISIPVRPYFLCSPFYRHQTQTLATITNTRNLDGVSSFGFGSASQRCISVYIRREKKHVSRGESAP